MAATIQLRRGTKAVATANNPTLKEGEIGLETDTFNFKIGDGTTAWNALDYAGVTAYPVGIVYWQFPGKASPIDMGLPGTWENISSDFAGDFFRAEGGNASAFESGQQTDANLSHGHTASFAGSALPTHDHTVGIVIGGSNAGGTYAYRSTTLYGTQTRTTSSKSAGTPAGSVTVVNDGGTESRPKNRTIRLWERTA